MTEREKDRGKSGGGADHVKPLRREEQGDLLADAVGGMFTQNEDDEGDVLDHVPESGGREAGDSAKGRATVDADSGAAESGAAWVSQLFAKAPPVPGAAASDSDSRSSTGQTQGR